MTPKPLLDSFRRPLANLRLSVTDRCNLRCSYCMPEEEYVWLPRERLLTFEEISTLVGVFARLGVRKVRLTGGEPLLRRGLDGLVQQILEHREIEDVALTTNGLLLADQASDLRAAGLGRITVSLDTIRPKRYHKLTRRDRLQDALDGIASAQDAGFQAIKLNCVLVRGENDDEVIDLLEFARTEGHELRFIEYMDVGGANLWKTERVVPQAEILERVSSHFGEVRPEGQRGSAPADRFLLPDGTRFGIVASTTAPFCSACDRSRLTADGTWFTCLYAPAGLDLRAPLRDGASAEDLCELLTSAWQVRQDRGAEVRLGLDDRTRLAQAEELQTNPHLEMHTRGG